MESLFLKTDKISDLANADSLAFGIFMHFVEHMDYENKADVLLVDIAEKFDVSLTTISNRVKMLEEMEFVKVIPSGRSFIYFVNPDIVIAHKSEMRYVKEKCHEVRYLKERLLSDEKRVKEDAENILDGIFATNIGEDVEKVKISRVRYEQCYQDVLQLCKYLGGEYVKVFKQILGGVNE
ncbi:replication/maintenance protein RepL [Eubacterium oxidoreducens]|uniref:Replication protein (RepL) n=1 Tax=Eubacterium oxidoreducens TaxID=1732 RepID=A0A1G6B2N1_EUBOX|nr:helix-turn-helix domain-containing protein [Eubacterium oxidoreducens]SDB14917.1 replication protein (RepL) [Eubacterium oxidoreducens]